MALELEEPDTLVVDDQGNEGDGPVDIPEAHARAIPCIMAFQEDGLPCITGPERAVLREEMRCALQAPLENPDAKGFDVEMIRVPATSSRFTDGMGHQLEAG